MPLFDEGFRAEARRLDQMAQRRAAADMAVRDMTPDIAMRIRQVGDLFPWLNPGMAYSFGRYFSDAKQEELVRIATNAALVARHDPEAYAQLVGQSSDGKVKAGDVKKAPGFMGRVTSIGKGALRVAGAAMNVPVEVGEGAYRSVTEGGLSPMERVQRVGNVAAMFQPGGGGAIGGREGWDAREDIVRQTELGQLGATVADNIRDKGVTGAFSDIDTGSGFFVGGRVKEAQVAKQREFGTITYPDGSVHARSIGRDAAGLFLEPGTKPYTVVSGFVDFEKQLLGGKVTDAAFKARKMGARGMELAPGRRAAEAIREGRAMTTTERMLDEWGALRGKGSMYVVDPRRAEAFLSTERGGKITAKLAEITDPLVMDRLTGGRLPTDVLRDLVDTTDPGEMTKVLRTHLGVDIRQMPKVGRWQQLGLEMRESALYRPSLKRLAETVPEQVVPLDDERAFLTQLRRWGANVKMSDDRVSEYMQRALAVKGEFAEFARVDRRRILDEMVQEAAVKLRDDLAETHPWLRRFAGQSEDEIDGFVRKLWGLESRNRLDADVMYWVDAHGTNRAFIGARVGVDPAAQAAWDARVSAGNAAREAGSTNPWELTRSEFARDIAPDIIEGKKGQLGWDVASSSPVDKAKLAEHKAAVIEALESGRAVPQAVLDEYPDIARAYAPSADGLIEMPRRATPSNDADLARMSVPMPDVRTIRRAYDDPLFRATMKLKGVEGVEEMALKFQERWWKPTSILRVATVLRITLDSQMRMAHDNVTSLFHHPLDYISMALADTKLGSKVFDPKFMVDAKGQPLGKLAAMQDSLADVLTGSERSRNLYTEGKKLVTRDYGPIGRKVNGEFERGFFEAWHDNMASLHSSQVGKLTLSARDLEQAQEFFWKNMTGWREEFARRLPGWTDEMATAEGRAKLLREGKVAGDEMTAGHLLTRAGSDAYIADQWERMLAVTLGDPELRKAALEGTIDFGDTVRFFRDNGGDLDELGQPVSRVSMSAGHGARDPRFTKVLEDRFAHLVPENQRFVGAKLIEDDARKSAWNRATDWMFEHLYAASDNTLNRVPAYRQYVWRRVEELAPFLRGDDADDLIDAALKAGIDKRDVARIRAAVGTANHPERIDIDELNAMAKGHALSDVKDLLFDLHERSQFFDALRLIAPFGEAWREVMVRWPKYAVENPNILRKVGLARQVGMDPEAAALIGADQWETNEETGEREHRGLVYKNTFGELMFAYPMSAQMLGMVGLPEQPMVGRVAGLNVGFEAMPGVGPVAAIPLAKLMPDDSSWDGLRDIVFPYGEPKGGVVDRGSQVFLPGWLRKIVDTDVRGMAAYSMDAIRYHASTGEFNVSGEGASPEEVNRLEAKAKRDAVWLAALRGVGQFFLPSSPTYEPQVKDKDAQSVIANALAARLQQLREESPEGYVERFLEEHGAGAFAVLQGDTTQVSPGGGLPPTKAAFEWLKGHDGVRDEYALAYGFFAPQGGALDMNTYQRTIAWGERRQIDPKTLVELGNAMVARSVYYKVRNDVEERNKAAGRKSLTPTQSLQLYGIRQELEKRYPGYSAEGDPIPGTTAKATPEQVIDQLKRAVNDERLQDSPVTQPMKDYLAALAAVEEKSAKHLGDGKVQGRPESWVTSTKPYAASLRKALYDYGSQLAAESPDFTSAWEMVFLRQFDSQLAKDGV